MSLETRELQELLDTVRTERVVGHEDHGDLWDVPIFNRPERMEAAEKLASSGATEGLSALQGFFVESVLRIDLVSDTGGHNVATRSEVRRLAKALIILGGQESYGSMMLASVIPALEAKARAAPYAWEKQLQILAFLESEFGHIGDWEVQVTDKIVNERSLGAERLQELIVQVREPELRPQAVGEWGEPRHRVLGREMERQWAAAKLAFARATQALGALQDVFVKTVLELETRLVDLTGEKLNPDACRDLHGFANALLVLGRVDAFDSMMITRVIPPLEVEAAKELGWYESRRRIRREEMRLSFLRTAFGSIGTWEASVADRLACLEERLARRAEVVTIRDEAYAEQKAEEEQRILGIQQKRKTQRQCTMCGGRLGFMHRLRGAENHTKCRSFTE